MKQSFLTALEQASQSQEAATAHALDAVAYTASEITALERQAIFADSWQYVGHLSQLPRSGDLIVCEVAQRPLLIVRDPSNQIRAFYNICKHRAGPLATENGNVRQLSCKYHGWTYDLTGQLIAAPEMDSAENFKTCDVRLDSVVCDVWQGFIFVHLGEPEVSLEDALSDISHQIRPIDLAGMQFHHAEVYEVNCHWKVYMDNYLEGYHLPYVHPGLSKLLDYRQYDTELKPWYSCQYSPLQGGDNFYGDGKAWYYCAWPNLMLNILPGRCQVNLVVPLSNDRCRVHFDYYYADPESDHGRQLIEQDLAFSDEIQVEDISICEHVQKGLASGAYQAGRLCSRREQGVWHFQELIRNAYRGWLARVTD